MKLLSIFWNIATIVLRTFLFIGVLLFIIKYLTEASNGIENKYNDQINITFKMADPSSNNDLLNVPTTGGSTTTITTTTKTTATNVNISVVTTGDESKVDEGHSSNKERTETSVVKDTETTTTTKIPKASNTIFDDSVTSSNYDTTIGYIHGEYPCSYYTWNGLLLVGAKGVVFSGNFFLFEKKVVLLWDSIRQVCDGSTSTVDDVVDIIMNDSNRTVHRFSKISTATTTTTKLWIILLSIHNESILGDGDNDQPPLIQESNSIASSNTPGALSRKTMYRRRNSDPSRMSMAISPSQQQQQQQQQSLMILDTEEEDDEMDDSKNSANDRLTSLSINEVFASTTNFEGTGATELKGVEVVQDSNGNNNKEYGETKTTAVSTESILPQGAIQTATKTTATVATTTSAVTLTSISVSMEIAEIEKITGRMLLQPISCCNNDDGITGKLYVGRTALYFTGKRYFWEQSTVIIPWSNLQRIKTVIVVSDDTPKRQCVGISITTVVTPPAKTNNKSADNAYGNSRIYRFVDMDNANQVWASLTALQNEHSSLLRSQQQQQQSTDAGNGSQQTESSTTDRASRTHRRRNSDPFFRSSRLGLDAVATVIAENDTSDTNKRASPISGAKSTSSTGGASSSFTVEAVAAASSSVSVSSPSRKGSSISSDKPSVTISNEARQLQQLYTNDDNDGWAKATADSKKLYSTVLVPATQLKDCATIDTFYELFLSNGAKYSLFDNFLQTRGDTNIQVEEWNNPISSVNYYKRIVRYIHPVNAPLAPPQATARREQTYQHYGSSTGIIVESRTYVDDVPMADCFYVAERIMISPGTTPGSISIKIDFGISFVKSTMFKGIITKKTTSEVTELFQAMLSFINESLSSERSLQATSVLPTDSVEANAATCPDKTEVTVTAIKEEESEVAEKKETISVVPTTPVETDLKGTLIAVANTVTKLLTEVNQIQKIESISQVPVIPILLGVLVVLLLFIYFIQIRILSELRNIRTALACLH